jgi:hypothetical protein
VKQACSSILKSAEPAARDLAEQVARKLESSMPAGTAVAVASIPQEQRVQKAMDVLSARLLASGRIKVSKVANLRFGTPVSDGTSGGHVHGLVRDWDPLPKLELRVYEWQGRLWCEAYEFGHGPEDTPWAIPPPLWKLPAQ